ncbi:hypothetical protein [Streptomyces kanamyceticus]|uniref:hypothetical protein n=1 Tax=Streptomyces kanamyceticus TaxID=1967 RepID=UPI0037DD39BB
MAKTSVRTLRAVLRPALYATAGLALAALTVAAVTTGNSMWKSLWNGTPYPLVDPGAVTQRLKDRSDQVYERLALPGKYAADPGRVHVDGNCSYRGLRGVAHIDESRADVSSFALDWRVPDVPEATARDAQRRIRRHLAEGDWKLTHVEDRRGAAFRVLRFRAEGPDSGDQIDVRWNDSTTTLFVSVYAPCGQVPDTFDAYEWPGVDWEPKK